MSHDKRPDLLDRCLTGKELEHRINKVRTADVGPKEKSLNSEMSVPGAMRTAPSAALVVFKEQKPVREG